MKLTHVDHQGQATMVMIGHKRDSERIAIARGEVRMTSDTLGLIKKNQLQKGDVLNVSRIAGIMAAKNCSQWIPLCHPVMISGVDIKFRLVEETNTIEIEAEVRCTGKTGVEMEALTAVSAVGLTIYDMCKAVDQQMVIGNIRLIQKEGGQRGHFVREGETQWMEG